MVELETTNGPLLIERVKLVAVKVVAIVVGVGGGPPAVLIAYSCGLLSVNWSWL